MKLFIGVLILVVLSACSHQAMQADKHVAHCAALLSDTEIIQCYNSATSAMIARRISFHTRGLSDGDWPHSSQLLIQLQVEDTGLFKVESILNSSGSSFLDKKIVRTLADIKVLFVPQNELFYRAGYPRLKLLIKPAITPLLGSENLVDYDALVVYVRKVRR